MYLKKLEIFGFKSFADKTELLFEPGVTAVVGPNGCGKTNVADSIRWVMGEQSAKGLRAGEMTDVIFNGTDSRKASSMSEVSITLSNEDGALPIGFNEISVTRRVYRSGESEYLINQAPARLRDVKELFMGTGLGVGAYSVLAQGQMDQIVTSKPLDRRAIFEEAAGITKYKARKAEAIRKLDATEQNLVRISDITAEIKRQISTLERQAKQAEKYRQHKEELAKLQVLIHLDKAARLRGKLKDLHQKMGSVQDRMESAQEAVRGLEQEEKQQRALLAGIEEELAGVKEAAYKAQSEVEVTEGKMEGAKRHKGILSDQRRRNEQNVAEAGGRIEQLKVWVSERLGLLRNKEEQRREKEALKGTLEAEVASLESELSTRNQDLESKSTAAQDLLQRAAQMKAELESLRSQDEETSRRVSDLESQVKVLDLEIGSLEERLVVWTKEKGAAQVSEAQADEDILRSQGDISAQGTKIEEAQEKLQKLNNETSEARSRLGVLEELQNKLSGYDSGVKEILRAKQVEPLMWQEVLGIVADLLVVDKEHENAVETLLGSQLQSLVVGTREAARRVSAHLKAQGQGKVSLFILEDLVRLAPQGLPSEALAQAGAEGPVRSFLKYDQKMEPVVGFLFEQDLLVQGEEAAERLSSLYPRGRFVTRDGDRWGPLGSLKAGSPSLGVSLLGRHREMSELSEKIKGLEAALLASETELSGFKRARKAAEDSFLESETRRQSLRIRLAELEKEITQTQATLTSSKGRKAVEEKELASEQAHWKADQERIGELNGALRASEQDQHLTQEGIADARRGLQDLQARREDASRRLLQAGLELSSLEEVALRSQEEADRYQKEAEQLALSVTQKQEENRQLDLQEQQLSLDLDDLLRKVGGLGQAKQVADSRVGEIQTKREAVASEAEERAEKVRKARVKFEEVQRELHSLEVTQAQFEVETRTIEEKLQVEFKVDLEAPFVALEEDFDSSAAEKESVELRAKIERLGLVNMVAVEEYDELSQRYKFLSEQRDDLLKAKDDLQKAIHKINLTSKELFASTFATVQENFKDIFQRLFEGGRAELILIDEGDVLESGIEIVARPPGKRLQSVSLLSGGEKALTAIALLFALFMVKPSPFCLLDEIDAPLDDVNVGRFTHLLKEFAKRTQFIMITHNKVSMETADVMYGVTMQESGVSRIISTRFREGAPEGTPVP